MRMSVSRGFIVAVILAATFGVAHAQNASVPARSKPESTSPVSQPTSGALDDLQWSEIGASAQCRDGTFFHGAPAQGACFDHGGVRKWLDGRLQ
jgi:hypothetical protein